MYGDMHTEAEDAAENGTTLGPVLFADDTRLPTVLIVYIVVGCMAVLSVILGIASFLVERRHKSHRIILGQKVKLIPHKESYTPPERHVSTHVMLVLADKMGSSGKDRCTQLHKVQEETAISHKL